MNRFTRQRPEAAHGGQPCDTVVINSTETDQLMQAAAWLTPKAVQEIGSRSDCLAGTRHSLGPTRRIGSQGYQRLPSQVVARDGYWSNPKQGKTTKGLAISRQCGACR